MSITPENLRSGSFSPNPSREESLVKLVAQRVFVGLASGFICAGPAALAVYIVRSTSVGEARSNATAEIGLVVYASCMTACSTVAREVLMPLCTVVCVPLLASFLP